MAVISYHDLKNTWKLEFVVITVSIIIIIISIIVLLGDEEIHEVER